SGVGQVDRGIGLGRAVSGGRARRIGPVHPGTAGAPCWVISRPSSRCLTPAASVTVVLTRSWISGREGESFSERHSGFERNLQGYIRAPSVTSRTREFAVGGREGENLRRTAGNSKRRGPWLSAFLGNSVARSARRGTNQLPERDALRNNARPL